MKRVLVCGGREFNQFAVLCAKLDMVRIKHPELFVIHGDCRGADKLAEKWCKMRGVPFKAYPADWDQFKKAAGAIRNQQMLDTGIDGVVAFPGGNGTADMVDRAKAAGVPVWEIRT